MEMKYGDIVYIDVHYTNDGDYDGFTDLGVLLLNKHNQLIFFPFTDGDIDDIGDETPIRDVIDASDEDNGATIYKTVGNIFDDVSYLEKQAKNGIYRDRPTCLDYLKSLEVPLK